MVSCLLSDSAIFRLNTVACKYLKLGYIPILHSLSLCQYLINMINVFSSVSCTGIISGQREVTLSEFSRSLVQSSIVSAIESVKLDSVKSQTQVNSQNSKGKLEHKPQKKKHKTKRSKELKKESGNGVAALKPGKADSTVK